MEKHKKVHDSSKPIIEEEIYGSTAVAGIYFMMKKILRSISRKLILNVVCVASV